MGLKDFIMGPKIRALINLLLTIFVGVLSSVLASQIMPGGDLSWSLTYQVSGFWMLIVAAVMLLSFQWFCIGFDDSITRFLDEKRCLAYVRKTQLDGFAEHIKQNPQEAMLTDAKVVMKRMGIK